MKKTALLVISILSALCLAAGASAASARLDRLSTPTTVTLENATVKDSIPNPPCAGTELK